MIAKSTWLHLRIPFSFYLLPVFLFAWSISEQQGGWQTILIFVIIHVFLYPASNAYNSYFDKDEESIGGLEKPPPVTKELYYTALAFDLFALLLGFLIGWHFVLMLLVYGLVSKAYSHPIIRIKKYAIGSWLIAGFFQGFFAFLMIHLAIDGLSFEVLMKKEVLIPAVLTSIMLWGSYPMTQIYQHKEDSRRGDQTLSLKLGILGTFHFTGVLFSISTVLFVLYFFHYHSSAITVIYLLFLTPVLAYFMKWYIDTRRDLSKANFKRTMRLNFISSVFLNAFFLWLGLM